MTRSSGNAKPEFRIAARTRSRLSRTEGSGRPTVEKVGRPWLTSTSTRTRVASIPVRQAEKTRASTGDRLPVRGTPRPPRRPREGTPPGARSLRRGGPDGHWGRRPPPRRTAPASGGCAPASSTPRRVAVQEPDQARRARFRSGASRILAQLQASALAAVSAPDTARIRPASRGRASGRIRRSGADPAPSEESRSEEALCPHFPVDLLACHREL